MQAIRLMTGALEFFSLSGACMCVNASLALQATTPSSIDRVGLSLFLHGPAANDVRRRLLQIQILVELEERPATIGQTHSLCAYGLVFVCLSQNCLSDVSWRKQWPWMCYNGGPLCCHIIELDSDFLALYTIEYLQLHDCVYKRFRISFAMGMSRTMVGKAEVEVALRNGPRSTCTTILVGPLFLLIFKLPSSTVDLQSLVFDKSLSFIHLLRRPVDDLCDRQAYPFRAMRRICEPSATHL